VAAVVVAPEALEEGESTLTHRRRGLEEDAFGLLEDYEQN